ncbi:MAG: cobalamin B12-binding domain-containing protein, partial [Clostridia bacterium]
MKTLLVAINAKFTHTNLAVRSLQNALLAAGIAADFVEYTINQPLHDILADIVRREPKRLLFSCYIWNIAYVRALAEDFRLLNPQAQILLGGPEVSFDAEELLAQMPWADAIVCGEGEALLPSVLKIPQPKGIYRTSGCVDLDLLPFPYRDLDALK